MIVIVSTRRLFCLTTYLKIPRAPRGIRFLLLRRHLGPLVFWLVDGGPYTCSPRSLGGCTIRKVPLMEPTTANATLETVHIYILSNTGNSVSILLSLYCSCLCSWFLLSECCSSIAVGDGCTVLAPAFFIHFLRSAQTTKYLVTGRIHC